MDLLNDEHVHQILNDVYSPEKDEYRLKIDKQWRILRGDLEYFVEEHLKETFPKTYKLFTVSDNNLARKVTDKLSVAYKDQPSRTLSSENETDFYNSELDSIGAKWAWREFDMYFNYFKYACMWFSHYEDELGEERVILRPLRPNQFSRVVNNRGETEVFIVHLGNPYGTAHTIRGDGSLNVIQDEPEDNRTRDLLIWTKEQSIKLRISTTREGRSFERIPVLGNEESTNPLGRIPAIFSQDGNPHELPAFNNISEQTITNCFILSVIITAMGAQSFGQLVITHPESQTIPDVVQQGLFTFIKLPQASADEPATDAKYISPSPDLTGMMEVYKLHTMRVLDEHGVKGGESLNASGQEFSSGLDRLLSKMDTTEVVEMNQEIYSDKERELYELFKRFYELTGKFRFSSESISVEYQKPAPFMSEDEMLKNIQTKLDLGIIQKWEAITELNPNMKPEMAKEKIERIEKERLKNNSLFAGQVMEKFNKDSENMRLSFANNKDEG